MKYSHFLCVSVLFLSFTLHAQNLEVEGKARITEMELKNDADSVVVVLADGTLARRDVSTLSEIQVLSISNDTIFLTNGGIVKLPVDMDAGWTMNVDTTSTTQYVGIGTINPNRKLHLVGDMELNGSLYSSGNISLANSLSYFGWDIYSDANAYSLSETNVSPRFKIIPGGNIGIGNITPSERLDIDGKVRVRMINNDNALDSVLVSDGSGVVHYRDKSTLGDGTGGWTEDVDTTSTTKFVGIGITNPLQKLDVNGNIQVNGNAGLLHSVSSFNYLKFVGNNDTHLSGAKWVRLKVGSDKLVVTADNVISSVNLGIGSGIVPTHPLDVDGQVRIRAMNNDNTLDSVLVSDGSGVLHYRELSSLPDSSATIQGTDGHTLNIRAKDEGTLAGNARGENSVDLQTIRSAATQVASGDFSTIGGGEKNTASGDRSTVGGGGVNSATVIYSTIGGGFSNTASGDYTSIGGGFGNTSSGSQAIIGGGRSNQATNTYSTVSGGQFNTASAHSSTIGGGDANVASGNRATVGGGGHHTASGQFSTVVGGNTLKAESYGETVVGIFNTPSGGSASTIVATDPIFVIGNGTAVGSESNAMTVLKSGNVGIGVLSPNEKLHVNGNVKVAGVISGVSDPVNAQDAATKAYVDALEYKLATITNILIDSGIINFVEDIDGNKYNTIKIGDQIWMATNLRVTKYNDGTSIPLVSDLAAWSILSTPAYTWYDTIGTNYGTYTQDTFGALYNYFTVSDTNSLNVCPVGWHVPTNVEWTTLTTTLGGTDVAGGKMKETGLVHWDSPNTGATNESGFTGVPGGQRTDVLSPAYRFIGERGYWWSSTVHGGIFAWFRSLDSSNDDVGVFNTRDKYGMSVRCLRD